jgi:hypothetical protein
MRTAIETPTSRLHEREDDLRAASRRAEKPSCVRIGLNALLGAFSRSIGAIEKALQNFVIDQPYAP